MLLSRSFLSLAALLVAGVAADANQDLGTVLGNTKNLTKFYDLFKKYPDVLLQLPSADGLTIIAPSNKAIENVPYTALNGVWDPEDKDKTTPILQYHIIDGMVKTKDLKEGPTYYETTLLKNPKYTNVTDGQSIVINKQSGDTVIITSGLGTRCTVTQPDILFQGGVIQVVDNLLIPPSDIGKTAAAFHTESFLGSLYASKLMPSLAYEKNVTIFAPQDAAMAAVGGTLQGYDSSKLARIMSYHVIPGQVLGSSELTNSTKFGTMAKGGPSNNTQLSVTIRQDGNNKYVNSAQIVQPDILLANGVMHIVADVLSPDAEDQKPNPDVGTQAPVFPVSTVSGAFTAALPCSTDCPSTTTGGAGNGTIAGTASATATTTSDLSSSTSEGAVAPRCTARVAGAAIGMIGFGAGMILL